jgi:hypothetical protein
MIEVFIHVPEQHAGAPVALGSAIESLLLLRPVPGMSEVLTLGGMVEEDVGAWSFILAGLQSGIPSFLQIPSSGRYAQIPRAYWEQFQPTSPVPVLFEGRPQAVGHEDEMIGQPVVIWNGSIEPIMMITGDLAKKMGGIPTPAVASEPLIAERARRGRSPGSFNYQSDPAIIAKVIRLCEDGEFTGPSRITAAVRSLLPEIDGTSDDSKLRRVAEAAKKLRPDLKK